MADPFQTARDAGLPTVGYSVLDAPSQRDRTIALMAQQGQALSPRDAARLARRQGVELETARLARASTGFSAPGVPVSSVDYLAGSRLDPRMQRAAALEAERSIELDPVLRDVQIAQAQRQLDEARFAMSPTARLAREAEAAAVASEALANVRLNQPFERTVAPVLDAETALPGAAAEPAVVAPAPATAPAAPAAPAQPANPFEQDKARLTSLAPTQRVQAARRQAREALLASVGPGGAVSNRQVREAEQQAAEAAMKVQTQKRRFTDPLTKHVLEYDVDVDGLGNVVRLNEPTISAFNPVTQKIDTDFAVQNQEWTTGGRQRAETNIRKLYSALTNLEKTGFEASFQSGGFAGLPLIRSAVDVVLDLPKATERQILSVASESLRELLGGQFAMKEGQQVLERAYDRYAKEGTNKQFVAALLDTIAETAAEREAQTNYFRQNGTLAGYQARPMVTNAGTLESRLEERMSQARASAPQTPAQQAVSSATAKAQQAAFEYLSKRRAAQAPAQ